MTAKTGEPARRSKRACHSARLEAGSEAARTPGRSPESDTATRRSERKAKEAAFAPDLAVSGKMVRFACRTGDEFRPRYASIFLRSNFPSAITRAVEPAPRFDLAMKTWKRSRS